MISANHLLRRPPTDNACIRGVMQRLRTAGVDFEPLVPPRDSMAHKLPGGAFFLSACGQT